MPRAELDQLQLERLQSLLVRLRRNVRRYRERLGDLRVESLADLGRLPTTTPDDLVASFPYGMLAFPLREVIRLHSTLGPGGKPLVIGHTRNDLAQWGRLAARQLVASGATANDVILISLGASLHAHALGYGLGAERIEASVIVEDPLHIDAQLAMLQNYRPTLLITTPTHAGELMQAMEQRRIDAQSLHLRTVLLSRPVPSETREQLAAGLCTAVCCSFGLGEILEPGLCVECAAGRLHLNEDQFLAETCEGELVLTTLAREAMPLLRYRTCLEAQLRRDKCDCGRTGAVLELGARFDQRRRVRELTFYDQQVAEVLAQTRAAGHRFQVEVSDRQAVVAIEISQALFAKAMFPGENPPHEIELELLARLGLEAQVRFVEPQS